MHHAGAKCERKGVGKHLFCPPVSALKQSWNPTTQIGNVAVHTRQIATTLAWLPAPRKAAAIFTSGQENHPTLRVKCCLRICAGIEAVSACARPAPGQFGCPGKAIPECRTVLRKRSTMALGWVLWQHNAPTPTRIFCVPAARYQPHRAVRGAGQGVHSVRSATQ